MFDTDKQINFNVMYLVSTTYRLFVCQDKNENERKDESFFSFWIKPVTNEPGLKSTMIH